VLTIGTYTNLSPLVSVGPVFLLCAFLGSSSPSSWRDVSGARERRRARAHRAALVVLEWVRTYIFGGFPWVALGYSQYRTTYLIQFAELTGVYGSRRSSSW